MEKQTSDHIFDLFFENSIDLLCIADKSGNFVKLNNAWTDTLGYQLTELEGRPYIEFVHPEDVESTIQATKQLANNQKVQHFINRYKHKNGIYRWIEWLSYPSEDTVYASAHDITDRIEAEQALKESESKYRRIVEDLPLALCVSDMEGNIKYINNTFIKYFGYELAEIPTIESWALLAFAGDDNNKTSAVFWQKNIEDIKQTKTPSILPKIYSVRSKSGKNFEPEITLVIIGNELYIFFNDVTEKQKIEEEIQKQVKLHQTILDTITVGLTFVKNRKQEWVNQSHCRIFGYEHEEMIGLETSAFYANVEDYEWIGAEGYNKLANGEVYFVEMPMKKKDGSIIWCSIAGKALDHEDLSKGAIWTLQDIDDRKKTELEIKKLNTELEKRVFDRTEQLQQANKDLEAFAYSISHDLRAPLRHIDGFVNLLYSNIQEPVDNVTNYYKKISAATKRLSVMIEELLSFSRLGRKEISYSNVNLQLLVSNVIENLKPEFAHRKINWIIGDLPVVYGDLSLLQFAFENIISNSIKYTGKKELAIIELGTLSKKENETGLLTVFIKDNGAGFDMKYADKLFGVFQRLHTNEEFEGIGIGLANVKQIVTKHKGSISVESEVDQGATFYITLPEPSENI